MRLTRKRRRKVRRFVGFLIVALAAVLVWSWPDGRTNARQGPDLLMQERAAGETGLVPAVVGTAGQAPARLSTGGEAGQASNTPALKLLPATPSKPATRPGDAPASATSSQPAIAVTSTTPPIQTASGDLRVGLQAMQDDRLLDARDRIGSALQAGLSDNDARIARQALADLAERTIFNRTVLKDDPLAYWHVVRSGDTIGRIAKQALVSEELLTRINELTNKNFIREGRRIKVLRGPFHARISKHQHELYLYLQDTYVRTMRVALGENSSTPVGKWKVANQLANPGWTDPRSGKRWHPDDPGNPIGEYWVGLEGIEGDAVGQVGYGVHGTIEPETIGQDVSMGCVRLASDDIAFVYHLLLPGHSIVTIAD